MKQIRLSGAAIAAMLMGASVLPAYAQSGSIQAQPLDAPPGAKAPIAAAPAQPMTSKPAAGYVTGDSAGEPQPLDGTPAAPAAPGYAPPLSVPANRTSDQQNLINRADVTLKYLHGNKDYAEADQYLAKAKAVFIVPQLVEAAFLIGGKGGQGVILARLPDNTWSAPSFAALGGMSIGLQAGAKSSEMIFFVMTDKGLNAILSRDVKLGGDISVALITVGKGLGASTAIDTDADIYAVAKADGLFGGAALDGTIISANEENNTAFYGHEIAARDILNGRVPPPQGAQALVEDLR